MDEASPSDAHHRGAEVESTRARLACMQQMARLLPTSAPAFKSLNCWLLERPPKAAHTARLYGLPNRPVAGQSTAKSGCRLVGR